MAENTKTISVVYRKGYALETLVSGYLTALKRTGYTIKEFAVENYSYKTIRGADYSSLLGFLKEPTDLFLVISGDKIYPTVVDCEIYQYIKNSSIPSVCIITEGSESSDRVAGRHAKSSKIFDFIFVVDELEALILKKHTDAEIIFFPCGGIDPEVFCPAEVPIKNEVWFLGTLHKHRLQDFFQFKKAINLKTDRFPTIIQYKEAMRAALINLSLRSAYPGLVGRAWEALLMGKLLVYPAIPERYGVQDIFQHGDDIIYYKNNDEAIDICRYYLNHPEEANLIGQDARYKILEKHTPKHLLDKMFEVLKW